ncbi:hypothetical protein [Allorhizocola rhizosphaerae]|uniref:hypothetical protein n=1 Tax=Allorhizocola rhizosphaerae TaxID=1872709 RepID=UPI0013C3620A|nr:hypothetical protein [Allorhizocola rhizosphaerae]
MKYPPLDELKATVLDPAPKIRDVIADAPRLAHTVADLESDRRAILAAFDVLSREVHDSRRVDESAADDLVQRLTAYRQRAADLLYQAYGVDLGGET